MFANKIWLFLYLTLTVFKLNAQESNVNYNEINHDIFYSIQDDTYGGDIILYQNPSLHVLVDRYARINKKEGLHGYRIQIFSGSGNSARTKANNVKSKLQNYFPEFDSDLIYFDYQAPYFKVIIGDYRNKNEAYEVYHIIKNKFPGSYIVKSKINFPKLNSNSIENE